MLLKFASASIPNNGSIMSLFSKIRNATLALALTIFPCAARAQQLSADDEKALLTKLREQRAKFPALTADFTEDRSTHLLNKPIRGTGTIAFHAPGKFRRELKGSSPSLTVSNGKELWIYYPNFSEAEHYTLGKNSSLTTASPPSPPD